MTDTTNDAQREYWSGRSARGWITYEAEQDAVLAPVAEAVLARAGLLPGERVLDIGCGTGALSVSAARVVGARGHVLACDISEPFLARAAERLAAHPHAVTLAADAATVDWPEPGFDAAISRFGVMFFADPPAAFANISRALLPGGRIVFAAWASAARNPFWSLPARISAERLGHPPKTPPDTPGPMGLADLDLAVERLRAGGLQQVTGEEIEVTLTHPEGAGGLAALLARVGPASRTLNHFNADEGDRRAVTEAITEAFGAWESPAGLALPARINLLTAVRD
ncbi:methyltransferase domain-containing protein [Alphaproteobacteria bacterium GH1-50]|uniref:Methyltransferase domain-containing protein n=1 Tax=Kangsaoukella pontilimi TaxID=2691042 RepID=A0A7C9IU22_9RHOB|nr:class I SAM-dependent methyltransferase [Kangsaoukella pontilimi]MXQ09345.1 methyltransferase domain-containing protein [Kangsaoukella pontilimi]